MEEAFRSLLIGNGSLTALVSNRISYGRRPQSVSELPAVVLEKVSAPREYNMDGPSGLVETRIQADCFGETYASAKTTARAVMGAVNGYSGTQSGVVIQRISIENERDSSGIESAANRYLFLTSIDFSIWHDE